MRLNAEKIGPALQCRTCLILILGAVIDSSDSIFMAGDVVNDGLDDVRRDTNLGHVGYDRAPDIMDRPRREHLGRL